MDGKCAGKRERWKAKDTILQHWIFEMNYTAKRSCTKDFEAIKSHTRTRTHNPNRICMCKSQSFVTISDFTDTHTHTCSMHIHGIVRAQIKKAYEACALHNAHNARSISILLIINKQEMHSISHIASFAIAALCKQDSAISCVCAHFVRSFSHLIYPCSCQIILIVSVFAMRNGMTFVEQRHRLLFEFKVAYID